MQRLTNKLFSMAFAASLLLAMATAAYAGVPVSSSFSTSVPANRQTAITLLGSDPEGTALTYAIVASPGHGALSNLDASSGALLYTPTTDYTGADSFTYTVTSGGQTSTAGTVTLMVTNAKTRIVDTIMDASGAPRSGTVTFILTQQVTTPSGISPKGATVSAALNASGQFDVQVYPSKSLFPEAYYQVWFADSRTLNRELIGIYEIPLSTASSILLAPYKVTDTNLAARYTFISAAQANAIGNTVGAIYNGSLLDNAVMKYDSATGKIEVSSLVDDGTTVSIANKVQLPGTKSIGWDSTGVAAPSTSNIFTGTKLLLYPGTAPDQSAIGVEAGFTWLTTGGGYKFYFDAANPSTWTANGLAIGAPGLQDAAALQVDSTTRGFLPPRLTAAQRTAMPEVQEGLFLYNSTTKRPNVFTTGWNEVAYLSDIPASPVTSVFGRTGVVVAATNDYSFSQISGSVTDAQVPNTITLDSFSQIGGSVTDSQVPDDITVTDIDASALTSGTIPNGRFPATLPASSGVNLTSLNATNLASGTVPDGRFPSTLPALSGVNLTALNASNLASGTLPDARFPSTLPALSGANLTTLNASNLSSGTVNTARLGSGTAASTTILTGDNAWTLPESLGLLDATSPAGGAYPIFLNSHTLGNGYLKQSTNLVYLDGAGSAPEFQFFTNGTFGATNRTLGVLSGDANVIELTARGSGTFSGQDTAIRLNSLNAGVIQFSQNGTVQWHIDGVGDLLPDSSNNIGSLSSPVNAVTVDEAFYFANTSQRQASFTSRSVDSVAIINSDEEGFGKLELADGVFDLAGFGSPEGAVTASPGSIYRRTSDGHIWRKDTGTGDDGWVDLSAGGGMGLTSGGLPYFNGSVFADSPLERVDATTVKSGYGQIGSMYTNFASFKNAASPIYAILQDTTGETFFSTAAGYAMGFRVNNVEKWTIDTNFNFVSSSGTIQINDGGTKPTCDSTKRGMLWQDFGGTGTKDTVEICAKDAADSYAWRTLY